MRNSKGFTLAELLILVAIIAVLAAIILPKLLRSRTAADEASAVSSITSINRAEVAYQSMYPTIGFASTLGALGPAAPGSVCRTANSSHACLLESVLSDATSPALAKSGYWFVISPTSRDTNGVVSGYVAGAAAAVFNQSGVRDFCSLEDGVIRFQVPKAQSAPVTAAAACAAMSILQ